MASWKETYAGWEGTAAELADAITSIAPDLSIPDEETRPNERLVRHYVQVGVLSRPERRGKEAYFGFRQMAEFLAARVLLADGWPLAKIAEFNQSTPTDRLVDLLPQGPATTRAQQIISKLQRSSLSRPAALRERRSPGQRPMEQSIRMLMERASTQEALDFFSEIAPEPTSGTYLRLELTTWCHVYVEQEALRRMEPDTAEHVGRALTQALIGERIRRGDKK